MGKIVKKKEIEVEETTYSCDFCDYTTERNIGCCGVRLIMECDICKRDACEDHRVLHYDDFGSDYLTRKHCEHCEKVYKSYVKMMEKEHLRHEIAIEGLEAAFKVEAVNTMNGTWKLPAPTDKIVIKAE